MVELSPEAKELLAQLREVDNPTPEERKSAHAAARRMLQAQPLRNLPRLPAARLQQDAAIQVSAARSGGASKLVWCLGTAVVATLGLFAALAWRTPLQPTGAVLTRPPAQSVQTPQQPVPPEAAVAPAPITPPPARSQARPEPATHLEGARPPVSSLGAELRFLSEVDAEIRQGAYNTALQRLDHHKGSAQLQEERAALRVLALCGRDNDQHAAHARAKFLKGSPSSVLAARVQAACRGAARP